MLDIGRFHRLGLVSPHSKPVISLSSAIGAPRAAALLLLRGYLRPSVDGLSVSQDKVIQDLLFHVVNETLPPGDKVRKLLVGSNISTVVWPKSRVLLSTKELWQLVPLSLNVSPLVRIILINLRNLRPFEVCILDSGTFSIMFEPMVKLNLNVRDIDDVLDMVFSCLSVSGTDIIVGEERILNIDVENVGRGLLSFGINVNARTWIKFSVLE